MKNNKIEKHILLFSLSTIFVAFILDFFIRFTGRINIFLESLIYFFVIIFLTRVLVFFIYAQLAKNFLGDRYKAEKNLRIQDFVIAHTVIVTTFLMKCFNNALSTSPLKDIKDSYTLIFIITIFSIIPIFYFVHFINKKLTEQHIFSPF